MFEERLTEFEPIFYPRSIAVVGASASLNKAGSGWVMALRAAGFRGAVYPVGASGGTIAGLQIFPRLSLVPADNIDYAIVAIPRESVLELLDECAAKKVKAVQFFTAGFSELGEVEGHELEREMLKRARKSGIRIIGPNCIGIYCPEHNLPSPLGTIGKPGCVGFISQSGGVAAKLIEIGVARHINYSKGVSFGNGIDLDASDFLQYLGADPKTRVVGAYLEGARDGRRLLSTLKEVARTKPVILWKGGRTDVGAQVAMSHTGSLASPAAVWSGMLRQTGVIEVRSLEELSDALLCFQCSPYWKRGGIGIVGGLADGGGGISVSASDACVENGLDVPPLSQETRDNLAQILGKVGSILRNPVDVSQAQPRGLPVLFQAIGLVARDTRIGLLLIQEDVDILLPVYSWKGVEEINEFFIHLVDKCNKPVVVVLPPGSAEKERLEVEQKLLAARVAVFPSVERAAKAISRFKQYSRWQVGEDRL